MKFKPILLYQHNVQHRITLQKKSGRLKPDLAFQTALVLVIISVHLFRKYDNERPEQNPLIRFCRTGIERLRFRQNRRHLRPRLLQTKIHRTKHRSERSSRQIPRLRRRGVRPQSCRYPLRNHQYLCTRSLLQRRRDSRFQRRNRTDFPAQPNRRLYACRTGQTCFRRQTRRA